MIDALFQPPADLVEQGILPPVDLAAGLVVGAPHLFALSFEGSCGALPLQLLRERGCETRGLFRLLERRVQLCQLGLQRGTAVLGLTIEFVYFGVEPAAVAGGHVVQQFLAAAGLTFGQCRGDRCRRLATHALNGRKVEQTAELCFVQYRAVIAETGKDEQIFRLQRAHGEARAHQPAAPASKRVQDGNVLATAGVLERDLGGGRGQRLLDGQGDLAEVLVDVAESMRFVDDDEVPGCLPEVGLLGACEVIGTEDDRVPLEGIEVSGADRLVKAPRLQDNGGEEEGKMPRIILRSACQL